MDTGYNYGSNNITLSFALKYQAKGWSIFPAKGKRPAIGSWEQYQNEVASEKQILAWFSGCTDHNIALVTGQISGLIAFDIDGVASREQFELILSTIDDPEIRDAIKNTTKVKTGGGNLHIVLAFDPGEFKNNEMRSSTLWQTGDQNHDEIRLKGGGGYIIAPPSTHPNGNRYEFINENLPVILPAVKLRRILDAFKADNNTAASSVECSKSLDEKSICDITAILAPYYKEGIRNDFILYLSGWFRKEGVFLKSTLGIVEKLADRDGEKHYRLRTVEETYKKNDLTQIKGYSGLLTLITNLVGEDETAVNLLQSVQKFVLKDGNKDKHKNTGIESKRQSNYRSLLEIAKEHCSDFFVDEYQMPYASVSVDDHLEIISLRSRRFRSWLSNNFYQILKIVVDSQTIKDVINLLCAEAEFGNNKKNLCLRTAETYIPNKLTWYYDLTNQKWEFIEITSEGWRIVKNLVIFRRFTSQAEQMYPSKEYPPDIFDKFMKLLNVKGNENKLLLKCYIISLFLPEIPKPILMLHGEQGSAKSTLMELIKILVDPSIIHTLTFPRDINELIQQLYHNYVAYYDNVTNLREWISDQLCRVVTGSGFSKRVLFSDDDDYIYSLKRCIGFNGINLGATKADLLDRGLIIQLERLDKDKRLKIEDIWKNFDEIKQQLLGFMFDILVKVLRFKKQHSQLNLPGLPRMADYAECAEIISRCMGNPNNAFLNSYYKNIDLQTKEVLEASPVATCLRHFMLPRTVWEGTATSLLGELEVIAEDVKVNIHGKMWPKAPNYLSRRLNELRSNLREIGIIIEWSIDPNINTRVIKIKKVTPVSYISPENPIQTQLFPKNPGDAASDSVFFPPETRDTIHAQISHVGDTNDKYDTLQPSKSIVLG